MGLEPLLQGSNLWYSCLNYLLANRFFQIGWWSSSSSKTVNIWSFLISERSSTALLIDALSRAMRPHTNTNLSLAISVVGQKLASSPVVVNLSSGHLVCVLYPRDRVLLAAVCAEWPCEEGSPAIGCDDALEVDEFVVVGDYIDDMSGCQ
jgi:hypothetical protein